MGCPDADAVSFIPSRVEGLAGVSLVVVHPDRLELVTGDTRRAFSFAGIGRPLGAGLLRRVLGRARLYVASRDFCQAPSDRYFRWYTDPPLITFMPSDEVADYATCTFSRIREIVRAGGFDTYDLA
jgi:hypothetical protein